MTLPSDPPREIACDADEGFNRWVAQSAGTVAVTTYQAGKVALIGSAGKQLLVLMRHFPKPLGMAVAGDHIALATQHEVWQFANAPYLAGEYVESQPGRYDALFLPRAKHYTSDVHIHDVVYDHAGLLLVNTRFSCLARLSDRYNFEPVWRPPFISDLVPEDRCHLNGVALRDGRAAYVTVLGKTDSRGGWRDNKAAGGAILEVDSGETVAAGLSMPHSPRWHDGRLWFLNSGAGELCSVDPTGGAVTTVCQLPAYLRGLCFVGNVALIGMSTIREKHIFGGLPVQDRCDDLVCGVAAVDLASGREMGRFTFTAGCSELYDTQFVPGVQRANILNDEKDAHRQAIALPECSFWLRPSSEIPDGTESAASTSLSRNPDRNIASDVGPRPDAAPQSETPLS